MSEELCDGVTMLVLRMQTNPEDFEYGCKMFEYANMAAELMDKNVHQRLWFLSAAEKKALITAYTDMHKQRFTSGVVQTIFSPEPKYDINTDTLYFPGASAQTLTAAAQAMGHNPSKMLIPPSMAERAEQLLLEESKKRYANRHNPRP